MNSLSYRAKKFLEKHKRYLTTTNRDDIIESFRINKAPVFEPLIHFQQDYSGYEFMAGLEPVYFTLLHGDGGYPRTNTAEIKYYESSHDSAKYQYICAQTEYQMTFTLDEYGRYYEDGEIIASNFTKAIEHMTLWDELRQNENFKVLIRDQPLKTQHIEQKLGLNILPDASDAYSLWFKNDAIYLYQHNGLTTIITSDQFERVQKLLE